MFFGFLWSPWYQNILKWVLVGMEIELVNETSKLSKKLVDVIISNFFSFSLTVIFNMIH